MTLSPTARFVKGDPEQLVRALLPRTATCAVDVGANTGSVTRVMLERMVDGQVIAVEPDARSWRELEQIGTLVTVHRCAAGATSGTAPLHLMPDARLTSIYPVERGASVGETVPVRRLDDLVERADCVKVDAQGADAAVLEGAPRLLRQCPLWIVEVWPAGLATAGATVADIYLRLKDAGLTVSWANHAPVEPEHLALWAEAGPTFCNWLAVRPI